MKIVRALSICTFLLTTAAVANALDPGKRITQYRHRTWRTEDGTLPRAMGPISQSKTGYLVLGGFTGGGFRFDGVRFSPDSSMIAEIGGFNRFVSAKAGGFWVSDPRGVSHIDGMRVLAHFDLPGSAPAGMAEDTDGSLWVTRAPYTKGSKPLCHISGQSVHCFGEADGLSLTPAFAMTPDGKGGVWIGTDMSVVHWESGHSETYEYKELRNNAGGEGVSSIVPAADGSMWVATTELGLQILNRGLSRPFKTRAFDGSKLSILTMLMDRDQNLWIGTESNGIYRVHGETVDHFGKTDGLSSDAVYRIFEDREGIIWATTGGGLDSFTDRSVTTFSTSEGLPRDFVVSVVATRDGTIWLGNIKSLDSIRDGVVSSIGPKNGLPGGQVTFLFEDRAGNLWVGLDQELFLYNHDHFRRIAGRDHRSVGMVGGITEDIDGNIWAECWSNPRKLVRIRDFEVQEEFFDAQVPFGWALAPNPKGGIWISTASRDLVLFRNGTVRTFPLHLKDLPRQIEAEADASVLVAAPSEGLIQVGLDKIQRLTKANGLPCDGVFSFLQDNQKDWWLATPCGYVFVAGSEMQRWWQHPEIVVQYRLLDNSDGARPGPPPFRPAAKSPDGRLWFATDTVAQSIDPRHLLFNSHPPPVHIEQISADHRAYEADSVQSARIDLPANVHDLEIDYTALSMVAPEKVFFKYRLDGVDHEWQDAGIRRQAFYTNVGPGSYSFHVIACNNSGVWNEEGASITLFVAPAYYQTVWFRILCVAVVVVIAWVLYRMRVRQISNAISIRFDERLAERTRIARDFHDTLLQTIQGTKLMADSALKQAADPGRMRGAMEQISLWMGEATEGGRAALNSLRTSTTETNDLADAFRRSMEECRTNGSMEASFSVAGTVSEMHPIVRDEVYRIGYEAIRNACVHSHGTKVQVELTYAEDLLLRVRDDGVGIEARILEEGKEGHFGLQGMRERAQRIMAKLNVDTSEDSGTEIKLIVPGSIIYRKPSFGRGKFGAIRTLFKRDGSSSGSIKD